MKLIPSMAMKKVTKMQREGDKHPATALNKERLYLERSLSSNFNLALHLDVFFFMDTDFICCLFFIKWILRT